jgi:hypothetical protein
MTSDTKSGERGFIDAQLLTTVIFSRNAVVAPRVVSSPTLLKATARALPCARAQSARDYTVRVILGQD